MLESTPWQLLAAKGEEIKVKEGAQKPYFLLADEQNLVRGFGGCNNFTGTYALKGDTLEFSKIAATMKMCADTMDQELLFFSILSGTAAYKLIGEELQLFDDEKKLIGSLKAIPPQ